MKLAQKYNFQWKDHYREHNRAASWKKAATLHITSAAPSAMCTALVSPCSAPLKDQSPVVAPPSIGQYPRRFLRTWRFDTVAVFGSLILFLFSRHGAKFTSHLSTTTHELNHQNQSQQQTHFLLWCHVSHTFNRENALEEARLLG
jgi:hypothetical protein